MQLIRPRPERRRWKRYWLNAPIRVFTDSAVIDGRGIRLSEGGIYLFALANLAPGEEIRIEYPASESDEPLSRSGVVRNRAIYLYGIEFFADQKQSNPPMRAVKALSPDRAAQLQSSTEN
jgi:PilZ domain-containing protein